MNGTVRFVIASLKTGVRSALKLGIGYIFILTAVLIAFGISLKLHASVISSYSSDATKYTSAASLQTAFTALLIVSLPLLAFSKWLMKHPVVRFAFALWLSFLLINMNSITSPPEAAPRLMVCSSIAAAVVFSLIFINGTSPVVRPLGYGLLVGFIILKMFIPHVLSAVVYTVKTAESGLGEFISGLTDHKNRPLAVSCADFHHRRVECFTTRGKELQIKCGYWQDERGIITLYESPSGRDVTLGRMISPASEEIVNAAWKQICSAKSPTSAQRQMTPRTQTQRPVRATRRVQPQRVQEQAVQIVTQPPVEEYSEKKITVEPPEYQQHVTVTPQLLEDICKPKSERGKLGWIPISDSRQRAYQDIDGPVSFYVRIKDELRADRAKVRRSIFRATSDRCLVINGNRVGGNNSYFEGVVEHLNHNKRESSISVRLTSLVREDGSRANVISDVYHVSAVLENKSSSIVATIPENTYVRFNVSFPSQPLQIVMVRAQ